MKNIFKLVTILIMLVNANLNAQISKAEIRATGLTCSMCSNAINKQLKTLPEVINVTTDLNTNTFTVTLKDDLTLSPKIFKEKVEKAGFFIGSLILTIKPEMINQSAFILVNKLVSSDEEIQIQVIDKGYVTEKEFKKLSKSLKNLESYSLNNEDDFHIKILN